MAVGCIKRVVAALAGWLHYQDGCINSVAELTGWLHINRVFLYKKMNGHFAG